MKKNFFPGIMVAALLSLIIFGLSMKDEMNNYLSKAMIQQAPRQVIHDGERLIDSLYNYTLNEGGYQLTFLEFGAEGCISCRKMKKVMEQVKLQYPVKVNVVFMNALKEESQNLMKMYGISSIPTQILLDKKGKEYYRHSGYISFEELSKKF